MLIQNTNLEELNLESSKIFFSEIENIRNIKENIIIGLPGGRSLTGIYKIFHDAIFDWRGVHFFLVDERMVSINNEESNFKLIMDSFGTSLVKKGKIPEINFHPFKIENGLPSYNELFTYFGGFDIILLGVGEDGHCAALFPNHWSIQNEREIFFSINDSPKFPKDRMTASHTILTHAKVSIAFFINEIKRDALNKFLNKNLQIEQCPIKLVNQIPKHYEFTDISGKFIM
jgi:6-phosphogluconolactonase